MRLSSYLRSHVRSALAVLAALTFPCASATAQPCGSFEEVPLPAPGTAAQAVSHLAALSDGTAWAIGSQPETATVPELLYFDGISWSAQSLPSEAEGMFFGASCSTPDGDVWLVGTRTYTVYEVEVILLRARGGVIDRIDHVFHPRAPIAMSATSNSNVWALTSEGDVIHFDGSEWTEMDVPEPFTYRVYARGIYTAAPDDVWAVGYGGNLRGQYIAYAQHWDGSSWTTVSTPFDGQTVTFFRSVDGSGPDDVWVVGYVNYSQTIALHWDGGGWTEYPGPPSNAPLLDVAVLAPDDVWATPYSLSDFDVLYHWDGSDWSGALPLEPPAGATVRWGTNFSKAGPCDLWASGAYSMGGDSEMILARLQPDSDPSDVAPTIPDAEGLGFRLIGAEPNPLSVSTTLRFAVPRDAHVALAVHDAAGRWVTTLLDARLPAGEHTIGWNGRDADGREVGQGIYFVRMQSGGLLAVDKLAVIR